jgi:hypothetical protein
MPRDFLLFQTSTRMTNNYLVPAVAGGPQTVEIVIRCMRSNAIEPPVMAEGGSCSEKALAKDSHSSY